MAIMAAFRLPFSLTCLNQLIGASVAAMPAEHECRCSVYDCRGNAYTLHLHSCSAGMATNDAPMSWYKHAAVWQNRLVYLQVPW